MSLDGKILIGLLCAVPPINIPQLHFFSLVEGQYAFTTSVTIGQIEVDGAFPTILCISSDASTIFTSLYGNYFPNQLYSIVIVQQSSHTTWSIVQTVTNPQPGNGFNYGSPIYCTMDGSTLLVAASKFLIQPPVYELFVYTGPIPSPQVSVTPTATSTTSSTTSPTASASTSSTASPTLSSSATTSATSTSTSTTTTITSSTETPIPSPTSTSGSSSSSSSSSVSSFSSIENTAITVTSTALSILLLALCVTLVRRYYRKRSFRFCEEEDEEEEEEYNYNNLNAAIENRTDPLLRVN